MVLNIDFSIRGPHEGDANTKNNSEFVCINPYLQYLLNSNNLNNFIDAFSNTLTDNSFNLHARLLLEMHTNQTGRK